MANARPTALLWRYGVDVAKNVLRGVVTPAAAKAAAARDAASRSLRHPRLQDALHGRPSRAPSGDGSLPASEEASGAESVSGTVSRPPSGPLEGDDRGAAARVKGLLGGVTRLARRGAAAVKARRERGDAETRMRRGCGNEDVETHPFEMD